MYILIYIIAAVLTIQIYSCWENTYIEGVKDCLTETVTKGIQAILASNENYVLHYEIHLKIIQEN